MSPLSDHISALASAIHSRLSEGGDIVLTGFGRLQWAHEPARVEEREDGQKVLLPPQNVIRFAADTSLLTTSDDELVRALSEALPRHTRDPREILDDTVSKLRESFVGDKELVLENVGRFLVEDGLTVFKADDALLGIVNKLFAGLEPIGQTSEAVPVDYPSEAVLELSEDDQIQNEEVALEDSTEDAQADSPKEPDFVSRTTVLDLLAGQSVEGRGGDEVEALPQNEPTTNVLEDEAESTALPRVPTNDEAGIEVREEDPKEPLILSESKKHELVDLTNEEAGVQDAKIIAETKEAEEIDDDIDALLASVWTPAAATGGPEMPVNPSPNAASEFEDEASASEEFESEDDPSGALLVATTAGVSATGVASRTVVNENQSDRKRNGKAMWLVPAVLLLCAVAAVALWPRFNNGGASGSDAAERGNSTRSGDASTDTSLYATHAGGTSDSEQEEAANVSTFDSPLMQADEGASFRERRAEPVPERQQPAATPTAGPPPTATPAPPRPVAASPEPTQSQASTELPQQLRGPGNVNPAQGGSTWILASGNRTSAEDLASRYRQQGFRSSVLPGNANGLSVFRVAVGQFANSEEARSLRSHLPADAPASTWVLNF